MAPPLKKKRKVSSSPESPDSIVAPMPERKKTKGESEASLAPEQVSRLSDENPIWPAPASTIAKATEFIKRAARSNERILLIPDKDADGLSAGMIMKRTLVHLGAKPELIVEHHIPSGKNPASGSQREALESYKARWIIVLDQGSPAGPPLVKGAEMGWQSEEEGAVRTMVLDHHYVTDLDTEGPQGSLLLNACKSEPVSTSALLAWVVCRPMWEEGSSIDYLAIIGTCGDLSINVKWEPPWPDFEGEVKRWGRSKLGTAIAMLNAPRRTPMHDAVASWNALDASTNPIDILSSSTNPSYHRLNEARNLVKEETEKCTHTPPKFSKDSRIALLTIHSPYQVHPSVATRWSGSLRGAKKLQVVMCANTGFGSLGERYVHFSCRIANAAKTRGEKVNIIEILHEFAATDPTFLSDLKAAGEEQYAKGHKEASGGILPASFWKRFVEIMQIGVKNSPPPGGTPTKNSANKLPNQNNKLTNYFGKAA
ncbi:hypothetical protein CBS101457_002796 [Exobasidium rhododendri]|nr:hypothetical protein CBS101457_002796 [Exobasidium rhododendri]